MAAVGCQSNHTHVFLLVFTNISGISSNSKACVLDCFCCYMLKNYTTFRDILGQIFNIQLLWKPAWKNHETRLTTGLNHCCTSYCFSLNEIRAANSHGMLMIYPGWGSQLLSKDWDVKVISWLGVACYTKTCFALKLVIAPKMVLHSVHPPQGGVWALLSLNSLFSCLRICCRGG